MTLCGLRRELVNLQGDDGVVYLKENHVVEVKGKVVRHAIVTAAAVHKLQY